MAAAVGNSHLNSWTDVNLDRIIANIRCLTTDEIVEQEHADENEEFADSVLFAFDKKGSKSDGGNLKWISMEQSTEEKEKKSEEIKHENIRNKRKQKPRFSSTMDPGLNFEDCYITFDISESSSNSEPKTVTAKYDLGTFCKLKELMKKSVLTPDLEQKHTLLPYLESARQLKKQRQMERMKTKGDKWFNLPKGEMTEDIKNDLLALQMSSILDPKRFVKRSRFPTTPQYFQVGTIEDDPVDFYRARIPKKQRKPTIVEELLADTKFRQYNKRKYAEIQDKLITKRNKRGKKVK